MLKVLILTARFVYILIMILFIAFGWKCYRVLPSQTRASGFSKVQIGLIFAFQALSDVVIVWQTVSDEGDLTQLIWLFIFSLAVIIMYITIHLFHQGTGRLIWNAVFMMMSVSVVMLWRLNTSIAVRQIRWILLSFVMIHAVLFFMRKDWLYRIPVYVYILAAIGLILLPFVFPYSSGGSLNWATILGFSFQPSEIVKIIFIFVLGLIYAKERTFRGFAVTTAVTGVIAVTLLLQNDLGGVMLFGIVYLFMTYEYLENRLWLALGAVLVVLALFVAYHLVSHVKVRVDIWLDPWEDPLGSGYQILQSLFAIVGGGWFGTGLYQGIPNKIPVATTDMIFSAIAEEFGIVFCICLILLYLFLFMTMVEYSRHDTTAIKRTLLLGLAVLFMSQTFVIIGGVIKLIPLTGVTLPFISYGGSSTLSMCMLLALTQGIIRSSYPPHRKEVTIRDRRKEIPEDNRRAYRTVQSAYGQQTRVSGQRNTAVRETKNRQQTYPSRRPSSEERTKSQSKNVQDD